MVVMGWTLKVWARGQALALKVRLGPHTSQEDLNSFFAPERQLLLRKGKHLQETRVDKIVISFVTKKITRK